MAYSVRKKNAGWARPQNSSPHPVDAHVGQRLRTLRALRGMSQDALGQLVGLTFQQVQKYERGANRITASRLYDLARALDVEVAWFFDDMSSRTRDDAIGRLPCKGIDGHDDVGEMVDAYYAILDPAVRKRVYDLTKAVAEAR